MKKYIIRLGGLIPMYYAGSVFTCHPSEAMQFDSIEGLHQSVGEIETTKGVSIVTADTLEFVAWLN